MFDTITRTAKFHSLQPGNMNSLSGGILNNKCNNISHRIKNTR